MIEKCAGGIVLGDGGTVAMVWSKNSQAWLFPKGKQDPGEDDEQTAYREIEEETGLTNLEYLDDLGTYERQGVDGHSTKQIHMYLFAAPRGAIVTAQMEIEKAEWVPLARVPEVFGKNAEHPTWFAPDRAWYPTVFERVRQAIQRD